MINDSIMLISRTLLRSTSARLVSLVLEDFFLSTKKASSCKRENFLCHGNTVSSYHIREGWPVISLTRTNFLFSWTSEKHEEDTTLRNYSYL